MPLEFNGTEVKEVFFNGNEMDELYFNGTLVFKRVQTFTLTPGSAVQGAFTMYGYNPVNSGAGLLSTTAVRIDGEDTTWDTISTLLSDETTNDGMTFIIDGNFTVGRLDGVTAEISGTVITLTDGSVIYSPSDDYTLVLMGHTLTNVAEFSNKIEAAFNSHTVDILIDTP